MERLHLHIQQLQLELAETRERSGTFSDGPHVHQTNQKDASQIGQSNSNHLDMSGSGGTPGGSAGSLPNGNVDNASFVSVGNVQVVDSSSLTACWMHAGVHNSADIFYMAYID